MKGHFLKYIAILLPLCAALTIPTAAVIAQSMFDKVNDFDGDGKADYAIVRNENGLKVWHIMRSAAGYVSVQWGLSDDWVTAGDFDGDGRTDIAVSRLGSNAENQRVVTTYYLASSTGSVGVVSFGVMNIIGSVGVGAEDYDGDGKADPGLFQWHGVGFLAYRASSTGNTNSVSMGWIQVRVGDVTGDSIADVASYDFSLSEITVGGRKIRWGNGGDQWFPADFDGDNKGEIAIFRPATGDWWWLRSSDSVVNVVHFGLNGDVPVPADYDGDSKTDQAVYRPGSPNGIFYVNGSSVGFRVFAWGIPSDTAVQY